MSNEPVDIQSFTGDYLFLAKTFSSRLAFAGTTWPSAEHAYQAMKTNSQELQDIVRTAPSAEAATRLGSALEVRKDWDNVKRTLLQSITYQKFAANPALGSRLIATHPAKLSNGPEDTDELGAILMEVRLQLVAIQKGGEVLKHETLTSGLIRKQ